MISKEKHKKHGDIQKLEIGVFGVKELSIMGAPCSAIKALAHQIKSTLPGFNIAYVDASHDENAATPDFHLSILSQQSHVEAIYSPALNSFELKNQLRHSDLVLINGNHFEAAQQLVIIDPKKADSLKRKEDRLSNVVGFVLLDSGSEIPKWLLMRAGANSIPVFQIKDTLGITELIATSLLQKPRLRGLILAGGKSTRMGKDKGTIEYHGAPQREYVYHMLESMGIESYISCRKDQEQEIAQEGFKTITDRLLDMGPVGGIISSFMMHPNSAWLVVAVDLPFLDHAAVQKLINKRDVQKAATAYRGSQKDFPEPLATIWEPKSYHSLLNFLSLGYSCPRKVLINSDVKLVEPDSEQAIENINTPEELKKAMS